ncbi:MAG: hypothetical protein BMS9Abin07_2288 [Acidimicrobiia bacterium]|nr:MAG: hypothetical protein BMS9Abin07_2288 [Acidimicrobiia bacterium]
MADEDSGSAGDQAQTNDQVAAEPTRREDRIELIASIVLAVAVVFTAWAAFEAGKWGGQQSIKFSEAGAARTESTRADTRGGQLAQIDVAMYIDWVSALDSDIRDGNIPEIAAGDVYVPTLGTLSGFLFLRMRDDFRPALEAWLAADPINNAQAPATPFEMDEYVIPELLEAERLATEADQAAFDARAANQNGDNYVLTAVLFAATLFFSGVAAKLESRWNRRFVNLVGIIVVVVGAVILVQLPILL